MSGAEFDRHAAGYDGGLDNPIKRMMGNSADQFIAVKARWLLRQRARRCKSGSLRLLDYGCGAGDLMRVLAELGARAIVHRLRRVGRHAGRGGQALAAAPRARRRRSPRRTARARRSPTASSTSP